MSTDKPKLTAAELKPRCTGRWLEIFQALCPGLFDDAIANLGEHVTCPFHGGERDFRFLKKAGKKGGSTATCGVALCTCGTYLDGFNVLHKAMGGRFFDVLREVEAYLEGTSVTTKTFVAPKVEPKLSPEEQAAVDRRQLEKSNALWRYGALLNVKILPYYLTRGIPEDVCQDVQNVRMVKRLGYFQKKNGVPTEVGQFPAYLARMQAPDDSLVAVHRTWLTLDGAKKADVPDPRKLTASPSVVSAAIRLFDASNSSVLGLCEGVETGLGVRALATRGHFPGIGKIPVWACFAERNIRSFQIPERLLATLKTIIIFADNDASGTGMAAAKVLRARMAVEQPHLEVLIYVPRQTGFDWLNVWLGVQAGSDSGPFYPVKIEEPAPSKGELVEA